MISRPRPVFLLFPQSINQSKAIKKCIPHTDNQVQFHGSNVEKGKWKCNTYKTLSPFILGILSIEHQCIRELETFKPDDLVLVIDSIPSVFRCYNFNIVC